MLPPDDVTPALSNALRYSRATDLRCSSVMTCVERAMCAPVEGVDGQTAAAGTAGPRTGSSCAARAARCAKAMIGPSVAPPAQYARSDGDATQLPTP